MILMVQLATRGRRDKFLDCLKLHVDMLSGKNDVFFNISCDEDDESMNNSNTVNSIYKIYQSCFINFNRNTTKIEAINANVTERNFEVLLNTSDDMTPQIYGWDQEIRSAFEKNFPDYDGVVHFNDGVCEEGLNTLCIMGRPYYNRFGYIYWPEYKTYYCDNEFTEISKRLKRVIYIDKVIIKHDHHSFSNSKNNGDRDETFYRSEVHAKHDRNVWNNRLIHQNLGLDGHVWYQGYMEKAK